MNPNELSQFDLKPENIFENQKKMIFIKKWNWDYQKAWNFQKYAQTLIEDGKKIIIFTSHPYVLTMGRGLQKAKKGENLNLREFDPSEKINLPYPLFQIERGGGLTFHHPGQWIVYPILKLNPQLGLSKLVDDMFHMTMEILESFGIQNLKYKKDILGLWHIHQKVMSLGIAAHKMKTMHGLALNLHSFNEMKQNLNILSPCGLSFNTYTSIEELGFKLDHEILTEKFIQKVSHAW